MSAWWFAQGVTFSSQSHTSPSLSIDAIYWRTVLVVLALLVDLVICCEGKLSPVVGKRPASYDDRWDKGDGLPSQPANRDVDPRLKKILDKEDNKTI